MGVVLLLWSCGGGESGSSAGGKANREYRADWGAVTTAENGEPIDASEIFYIVYVGAAIYETTSTFLKFRIPKGCHMLYVTATRMDTDPWLESKPSDVVSICRE